MENLDNSLVKNKRSILIGLISSHKNVLENKKTNGTNLKEKEDC